ncbi:vascular cell adhesion protein 1b isoform X2 [Vanacampus margaritifer]
MTTRLLVCFLLSGALTAAVQVDISPSSSLFKLGERRQLSCAVRDCPVTPVISWSPLGDRPLGGRVRWRDRLSLLTFDPVEMVHEGLLLCKVTCGEQRKHAKTNIRIYGEEATLTCQVRDLYPAEMLTLDWLRGGQVVRSVAGKGGATSVQLAYTFTPQRAESEENLTCRATLDLRDLDPSDRARQTVVRLNVTFAPVVTALSDPGAVMSGSVLVLRCSASGNPTPLLTWTFTPEEGGAPQVKGQGEELALVAQAGEFRCEARNYQGRHSKAVRVRVNAAPANTSMWVSPSQDVVEGQRVTFTCHSDGDPPPSLLLSRQGADLCRSDSAPWLTFSLWVRPQDSAHYRCDATNAFGRQRVTRNLTVTAHPLLAEVRPQVALANVSSSLLLTCHTRGCSGTPALSWRRTDPEGDVTPTVTGPRLLLRDLRPQDGGGYMCRATCGNVTRLAQATVRVYSPPRKTSVLLLPSAAVSAGQNVTVSCQSDGFPAPEFVLEKMSDGTRRRSADGIFRLPNVTARDSGLYRVNASNVAGYHIGQFVLSVTEPNGKTLPVLGSVLLLAAVGAGGLAGAVLMVDYLRRSRKKGSYRLTPRAPPPDHHRLGNTCTP